MATKARTAATSTTRHGIVTLIARGRLRMVSVVYPAEPSVLTRGDLIPAPTPTLRSSEYDRCGIGEVVPLHEAFLEGLRWRTIAAVQQ